ncbi:MAG: hypothetical protein O8C61_03705 [Candidatus Methanoperedens sp.]|nr:hypothetical protein [Candidatus Methanoperedens sp.]
MDDLLTAIIGILGLFLTFIGFWAASNYDRMTRYNYLAERWYNLMGLNDDMPEFFNPEETKKYTTWSDEKTKTKYNQYARACWGFVEDIVGNDSWSWSYTEDYKDTIKDFIEHHHTWLLVNIDLFSSNKFWKVLERKREFREKIGKLNPDLYKYMEKKVKKKD